MYFFFPVLKWKVLRRLVRVCLFPCMFVYFFFFCFDCLWIVIKPFVFLSLLIKWLLLGMLDKGWEYWLGVILVLTDVFFLSLVIIHRKNFFILFCYFFVLYLSTKSIFFDDFSFLKNFGPLIYMIYLHAKESIPNVKFLVNWSFFLSTKF